jgi:hypothetical protein
VGTIVVFLKPKSTTQERDTSLERGPPNIYDPNHKFTFIPNMEVRQVVAFLGSEVWHGSPVLESILESQHDGERDGIVLRVIPRRKKESVDAGK